MKALVIDYGMGNLGSVRRALEECGAGVVISEDPCDLAGVERCVLPGVGAFGDGVAHLTARGWKEALSGWLKNPEFKLLGVCLGMQLLAEFGHEGGRNHGLGLIRGEVKRFEPNDAETRIPHVGWNEVRYRGVPSLFAGIPDGSDFYFVHSYHFVAARLEDVLAATPYCGGFVSAVGSGNVAGVQFHPEKSARPGLRLMRNFLG